MFAHFPLNEGNPLNDINYSAVKGSMNIVVR